MTETSKHSESPIDLRKMEQSVNWDKWRIIVDVTLQEAIALSLNVDPDHLRRVNEQILATNREWQVFRERMEIIQRRSGRGGSLQFTTPRRGYAAGGTENTISLREFVTWARVEAKWGIPDELAEIADEPLGKAPQHPGAKLDQANALEPGERTTLHKLGAYFARKYKYDLSAKKNDATGKIRHELERHGINLDDKTIRNLLRTGMNRFPDGGAGKQK